MCGRWRHRCQQRYYHAAAEVGGKIYTIGGHDNNGVYLSVVEEYDPASTTWTTKAPMPIARARLAAAAVGGKIYAVGGEGSGGPMNVVEEYDPASTTWTTKAPMPTARGNFGAAAVGGKIYAIGGYDFQNTGDVYLNVVEAYTPGPRLTGYILYKN